MPDDLTGLGAAEIARLVATRELSATDAIAAMINHIERVDEKINAVVVRRFDEARDEARRADESQARGDTLGPLHGVPITVKECFHVAGTPSTIGLTTRQNMRDTEDGVLVKRLRDAGAIILGKTNVSQLMMYQESTNPVYGVTNHPLDEMRGVGGSSGGQAAIIAAGGPPLGLGSDMGGSIRQPCHVCGIHGLKPTSGRLPTTGMTNNLPGMNGIAFQPGPMARRVEDLTLAMRVLCDENESPAFRDPTAVDVSKLRIGKYTDDGYFETSPAIRRAVDEAATQLESQGATVVPFEPPSVEEAVELFCAILASDGGSGLKRLVRGSQVDRNLSRLMLPTRLPAFIRPLLFAFLKLTGQEKSARLFAPCHKRSADQYWQLIAQRENYVKRFHNKMDEQNLDGLILPPHGVPAMHHNDSVDLLAAASYCFVINLVDLPAGTVSTTTVQADEQNARPDSRDWVDRLAKRTDKSSEGLPVGVQVVGRPFREDVALAIMSEIEDTPNS